VARLPHTERKRTGAVVGTGGQEQVDLRYMDISQLPFNRLIGVETAAPDSEFLVRLPGDEQYTNHLGTVHGSALLALAEAGSGAFLLRALGQSNGFIPVVRRVEAKFRKPAKGAVAARCVADEEAVAQWRRKLNEKERLSVAVPMEVVDAAGVVVLSAAVEWFISRDSSRD